MKTLTPTLVAEIRQRSRSGTVTAAALAAEYGVSWCAISNAAWGISFADVSWDGPPQWKYPVGGAARAKLTKQNAQAIDRRQLLTADTSCDEKKLSLVTSKS